MSSRANSKFMAASQRRAGKALDSGVRFYEEVYGKEGKELFAVQVKKLQQHRIGNSPRKQSASN